MKKAKKVDRPKLEEIYDTSSAGLRDYADDETIVRTLLRCIVCEREAEEQSESQQQNLQNLYEDGWRAGRAKLPDICTTFGHGAVCPTCVKKKG